MNTGPNAATGGLPQADVNFVRELMRDRAGIVIEDDKDYFIEMRLATLAADEGYRSSAALLAAVREADANSPIHKRVIDAMTIAETSFFRDLQPFESIRDVVLPRLVVEARERPVRIWSAACSTGQEAYSLALLVRDRFPSLVAGGLQIFATDLSGVSIERAAAGRYTQAEMNRGLPIQYLVRDFQKDGPDWVVRREIRAMIEFRELNLAGSWPILPRFDVILLRNVLIYLDPEVRRRLMARIARALATDGILVLGNGESHFATLPDFEPVSLGRSTVFRLAPGAALGGAA